MAEPNILLTRIDNRLIHGQVATQWNSTLGSNLILVANDEVSTNTMRQNLMKMAAPTGVQTRFFSCLLYTSSSHALRRRSTPREPPAGMPLGALPTCPDAGNSL